MIKFGVLTSPAHEYKVLRKVWKECERLCFDSAFVYDHLQDPPYAFSWYREPYYSFDLVPHERAEKETCVTSSISSNLECWTVLSALSSETKKMRLGSFVLCNNFRNPALTAKMASTLDVISNGRLEFGIGAGWYEKEHQAYGLPFHPINIRIHQLQEAIQIIKKMWTDEKASYEGEFYTVKEAINMPKPVQKPHPPIWIGGSGEKLLLRVVAELADAWSMPGKGSTPEQYKHKLEILEKHCESVGRKPEEITKGWQGEVLIVKKASELKQKIRIFKQGSPTQEIRDQSIEHYLATRVAGTPEQCVDKLNTYIDLGVTYFILIFPDMTEIKPLELFAEKVKSVLEGR